MFFGIVIRMYFGKSEHNPPHFHAYYNEYKATVDLNTCEFIVNNLPKKQAKFVLAWAEIHKEELKANWQLASQGESPFKIEPLK